MGLKVWLPLLGNLENKGTANVVCTNDGATIDSDGKIGQCYSFNNTHIIVDSTDIQNMFSSTSQPFSMACWMYLNSDETDRVIIFGNYNANPFVNWELEAKGTQRLCVGGTSNYTVKAGTISVPKTTWTHIACTYDGTNTTFYMNGTVTNVLTGANTLTAKTGTSRFWLGSDSRNDATRLKGRMNDFRIYDHCLSAAEVKDIARGLLVHYPMTHYSHGYGNPNLCNNSRTFGTGWAASGSIHSDKFNGFTVKYQDNTSGTNYSDIVRYPNVVTASQGQIFTASFWAKADTQHDIRCYFYNNTSGVVQVASGVSSTGTTTVYGDGQIYLTIPTEWKRFWITWTMNGSTGTAALRELLIGRNPAGGSAVYIAGVKLEEGNADTGWAPSLTDAPNEFCRMQDNSGYGHEGIFSTRVRFTGSNSPRHGYGAKLLGYTLLSPTNPVRSNTNAFSFNVWLNVASTVTNSKIIALRLNDDLCFNFGRNSSSTSTGYQYFLFHPTYYIGIGLTMSFNDWHMWTGTYDGTTSKLYKDGVLLGSTTSHTSYTYTDDRQDFLGTSASQVSDSCIVSDLRVYSTCLSATDIMELYKVNTRVDNKGNIHVYEFYENNTQKIQNNGIFESNYVSEFCPNLKYDKNVYVEPDGSKWIRIYHHNNPGAGSFSSTDDFAHSVYIDENRWFNVEVCNYMTTWEFMIKGKFTSTSAEWKLRFIQTKNPMTAAYADAASANVTRILTEGYSDYPSNWGGLYAKKGSAYLTTNNGNAGNWWGAIGSYSVYQSGIPGWGPTGTVTTTGFNDLYVRIDNINLNMGASFHKNGTINANQLIEI